MAFAAILTLGLVTLSACGLVDRIRGGGPNAAMDAAAVDPAPEGSLSAAAPLGTGQSAEALDQTSEAEKATATAAPSTAGERDLGIVVVALGSPAEQGFWLRSALVTDPAKGRVMLPNGKSVNLDLQPGNGAALLSLAAYRALDLALTDLPELRVYAN